MKNLPEPAPAAARAKKNARPEQAALKFKNILSKLQEIHSDDKPENSAAGLKAEMESVIQLRLDVLRYCDQELSDWIVALQQQLRKKPTPAQLAANKFSAFLTALVSIDAGPKSRALVERLDAEMDAVARLRCEALSYCREELETWLVRLQQLLHSSEEQSHSLSLEGLAEDAAKNGGEPPDAWITAQQADWRKAGEAIEENSGGDGDAPPEKISGADDGFNFSAADRDAITRFLEFVWRGGVADGKIARVNNGVVSFLALSYLCSASFLQDFDYRKLAGVKFGAGKSKYNAEVMRWAKVLNVRVPRARNTYRTEVAA